MSYIVHLDTQVFMANNAQYMRVYVLRLDFSNKGVKLFGF